MSKTKKLDFKEGGLEIGLYFLKFLIKSEYLHYGLFTEGLDTDVQNLAEAQRRYAELIVSTIPKDVNTILDVGCGSGKMAETLLQKGFKVDCVSPGNMLTKIAGERLGDSVNLFNCKFQDIVTDNKYDLVLFSESFQYIPISEAISGAEKVLRKGGYIVVCDFFKTDEQGKSPIGGGHKLKKWREFLAKSELKVLLENDITDQTAPTVDLINQLTMEVIYPSCKTLADIFGQRFPFITRIIKWKFRKRLHKLNHKHFEGRRNSTNFKKYKRYMLYLFQKP